MVWFSVANRCGFVGVVRVTTADPNHAMETVGVRRKNTELRLLVSAVCTSMRRRGLDSLLPLGASPKKTTQDVGPDGEGLVPPDESYLFRNDNVAKSRPDGERANGYEALSLRMKGGVSR